MRGAFSRCLGSALVLFGFIYGNARAGSQAETLHELQNAIQRGEVDPHASLMAHKSAIVAAIGAIVSEARQGGAIHDGVVHGYLRLTSHDASLSTWYLNTLRDSGVSRLKELAGWYGSVYTPLRRRAPQLPELKDFDGNRVNFGGLRGKVVLIDIWANNCSSCRESMPKKQAVFEKYRERGFVVLGLCVMDDESGLAANRRVLETQGVTYPNLAVYGSREQQQRILRDFGFTMMVGLYFLLDQQGHLVSADISGNWLDHEVGRLLGPVLIRR